jgi:hypothetical protein
MCLKSHRDLTERLDWLQSSFIIHHFEFNMWQDTQIVTSLCCISILPICFRIFFYRFYSSVFIYTSKYTHHIHTHLPFPYAHPLPLGPTPWKDLILPFCLSCFLKVYIDIQGGGGCRDISDLYILYFNQINLPLLTLSLPPYSPIIQQLTAHYIILYYIILCYIHI